MGAISLRLRLNKHNETKTSDRTYSNIGLRYLGSRIFFFPSFQSDGWWETFLSLVNLAYCCLEVVLTIVNNDNKCFINKPWWLCDVIASTKETTGNEGQVEVQHSKIKSVAVNFHVVCWSLMTIEAVNKYHTYGVYGDGIGSSGIVRTLHYQVDTLNTTFFIQHPSRMEYFKADTYISSKFRQNPTYSTPVLWPCPSSLVRTVLHQGTNSTTTWVMTISPHRPKWNIDQPVQGLNRGKTRARGRSRQKSVLYSCIPPTKI